MKKTLLLVLLVMISTGMFAQESSPAIETQPSSKPSIEAFPRPRLGDQMLSISAGGLLPLFFQFTKDFSTTPTNLSFGGFGGIKWAGYLAESHRLGFDFGGAFSSSPNGRMLYMVPVLFAYDYMLYAFPFEAPIHASMGVTFNSLGDLFHIDPVIKIGTSFLYDYAPDWSFGINVHYWWIMQLYTDDPDSPPPSQSAFGNFLELSLVAEYRIR
ncbi:hypothetical protein WKV44_04960 [Spirochaetia bacterium 38H-sp]|uniref:Outer membrane protein beta-barrel domain-containing protein n=1 Tax=Rarispira pelagica TaxID=3141764 RepID=A0ABU9UB51_9SPIR